MMKMSSFLHLPPWYTSSVQRQVWHHLTAPFNDAALEWRVLEVAGERARLRPQLRYAAVLERLRRYLEPEQWSLRYRRGPQGSLIAELTLCGVTRAAVVGTRQRALPPEVAAQDALVYAAELFGLLPPADPAVAYWVDYDPEAQQPLYEPSRPAAPPATPEKPAGQQAIDRLVDRLRQSGRGLEAAKLINRYGGYGSNPQLARELYGALRALLRDELAGAEPS